MTTKENLSFRIICERLQKNLYETKANSLSDNFNTISRWYFDTFHSRGEFEVLVVVVKGEDHNTNKRFEVDICRRFDSEEIILTLSFASEQIEEDGLRIVEFFHCPDDFLRFIEQAKLTDWFQVADRVGPVAISGKFSVEQGRKVRV